MTAMDGSWPTDRRALEELQWELGAVETEPWMMTAPPLVVGVYACFERGRASSRGQERGWAGAVSQRAEVIVDRACVTGRAPAPYVPGCLAMRQGPLLERAARALSQCAEVLCVNAGGRDHERRAGLALHLGAVMGVPSIGVTEDPLVGTGPPPGEEPWDSSPVTIDGELVAALVRVKRGARPICIHAGWRTDVDTAIGVTRSLAHTARMPWPLREARTRAMLARSMGQGCRHGG